jgi:hypothetical protein
MSPLTLDDDAIDVLRDILFLEAADAHVAACRPGTGPNEHKLRGHAELLHRMAVALDRDLTLAPAEVDALAHVVRSQLTDLRVALADTTTPDARADLRAQISALRRILDQLTRV